MTSKRPQTAHSIHGTLDGAAMRRKYPLIAMLVGGPLGWLTGAIIAEDDGFAVGIATGVATGLLTGGITAGYVAWRDWVWAKWGATVCARYEAEGVVNHGQARIGRSVGIDVGLALVGAYHLLGGGIDGWLVLTKQRLVFQQRSFRGQATEIGLTDIAGARRGDGLVSNTLELRLRNHRRIEIRVRECREWLDKLRLHGVTVLG